MLQLARKCCSRAHSVVEKQSRFCERASVNTNRQKHITKIFLTDRLTLKTKNILKRGSHLCILEMIKKKSKFAAKFNLRTKITLLTVYYGILRIVKWKFNLPTPYLTWKTCKFDYFLFHLPKNNLVYFDTLSIINHRTICSRIRETVLRLRFFQAF